MTFITRSGLLPQHSLSDVVRWALKAPGLSNIYDAVQVQVRDDSGFTLDPKMFREYETRMTKVISLSKYA